MNVQRDERACPRDGFPAILASESASTVDKKRLRVSKSQRELAQALAGGSENRVGHRRSNGRDGGLAKPSRWIIRVHDVSFDLRRIVDADDVIVGITLLNRCTLLEIDAPLQGCRQSPNNAAFSLPFQPFRINYDPTIDNADHAVDPHFAVPPVHRYLSHLR